MHGTGEKEHFLWHTKFLNYLQGVSLIFEYAWFLLQQTKNSDISHTLIDFATKAYQISGTQAAVLSALQPAIREHCDNLDNLIDVIIGIIHTHRMCKLILIQTNIWNV